MRRRFQKGSLQKVRGAWVARWWQDGRAQGANSRANFADDEGASAIRIGGSRRSRSTTGGRTIGAEEPSVISFRMSICRFTGESGSARPR